MVRGGEFVMKGEREEGGGAGGGGGVQVEERGGGRERGGAKVNSGHRSLLTKKIHIWSLLATFFLKGPFSQNSGLKRSFVTNFPFNYRLAYP